MSSRFQRCILSSWGKRHLGQWFYRCGPQMSSIVILWNLLELQILRHYARIKELETLEVGASSLVHKLCR